MNCFRTTLALAVLLPVTLGAADGPPPPDRPFESVRQDLGALKTAPFGVVPGQGLNLGAAPGISGAGNFSTPPAVSAPARQPEPASTTQPAKSSGWLLDALEENSRKAGTGVSPAGRLDDSSSADEKEQDAKARDAANDATRKAISTLPNLVNSPLSGYLSAWLSPDEFRRLGSLYPEMAGKASSQDGASDPNAQRRPAAGPATTTSGMTGQAAPGLESGGNGLDRPQDNPFVQAMKVPPRALPPMTPVEAPRVVPLPSVITPTPAAELAKPPPLVPEAPGADDKKYFPQLKRF